MSAALTYANRAVEYDHEAEYIDQSTKQKVEEEEESSLSSEVTSDQLISQLNLLYLLLATNNDHERSYQLVQKLTKKIRGIKKRLHVQIITATTFQLRLLIASPVLFIASDKLLVQAGLPIAMRHVELESLCLYYTALLQVLNKDWHLARESLERSLAANSHQQQQNSDLARAISFQAEIVRLQIDESVSALSTTETISKRSCSFIARSSVGYPAVLSSPRNDSPQHLFLNSISSPTRKKAHSLNSNNQAGSTQIWTYSPLTFEEPSLQNQKQQQYKTMHHILRIARHTSFEASRKDKIKAIVNKNNDFSYLMSHQSDLNQSHSTSASLCTKGQSLGGQRQPIKESNMARDFEEPSETAQPLRRVKLIKRRNISKDIKENQIISNSYQNLIQISKQSSQPLVTPLIQANQKLRRKSTEGMPSSNGHQSVSLASLFSSSAARQRFFSGQTIPLKKHDLTQQNQRLVPPASSIKQSWEEGSSYQPFIASLQKKITRTASLGITKKKSSSVCIRLKCEPSEVSFKPSTARNRSKDSADNENSNSYMQMLLLQQLTKRPPNKLINNVNISTCTSTARVRKVPVAITHSSSERMKQVIVTNSSSGLSTPYPRSSLMKEKQQQYGIQIAKRRFKPKLPLPSLQREETKLNAFVNSNQIQFLSALVKRINSKLNFLKIHTQDPITSSKLFLEQHLSSNTSDDDDVDDTIL